MKFTTLIPMHANDGTKFPRALLRSLVDDLAIAFGGCSEEGITKGQWIDPADATLYRDECIRVSLVCEREMLEQARDAVVEIGKQLDQRAMYFEVRDFDGVQILRVPSP